MGTITTNVDRERAATFLASSGDEASSSKITLDNAARRAAYRPQQSTDEPVTASLDGVRENLTTDLTHLEYRPQQWASTALAIARLDEVLGTYERARQLIAKIERRSDDAELLRETSAIKRRLARQGDELEQERLVDLISEQAESEDANSTVLLDLERAQAAWRAGAEPDELLDVLDGVSRSPALKTGDFFDIWRTQLHLDALLEAGQVDEALELLDWSSAQVDDSRLRKALKSRLGVWLNLIGATARSRDVLKDLHDEDGLPGDLLDFVFFLELEAGDRDSAFRMVRDLEPENATDAGFALSAASMLRSRGDGVLALDFLSELEPTSRYQKRHTLRLKEQIYQDKKQREPVDNSGVDSDLIDVLNERLECTDTKTGEVHTLCRLGRLYETAAGLSQAAAEVYREALAKDPTCRRAFKSLTRLYSKNDNWQQLADLYEDWLDTVGVSDWRIGLKLAKLYQHRLDKPEEALQAYHSVLNEKPDYRPAIRGASQLLENAERWRELAELYEKSADATSESRHQQRLLRKVAHLAEHKCGDDAYAIDIWQQLLALDPARADAYEALRRLLSRNERWHTLIDVNGREIQQLDSVGAVVNLKFQNAEIAKDRIGDLQLAGEWYERTLETEPTFAPALDALEHIYIQREQWADYMDMINRELQALNNPSRALERLEQLGELFEYHYDSPVKAIDVYEKIRELESGHEIAGQALERLYRLDGQWQQLRQLLEERADKTTDEGREAAIRGELAELLEWRLEHLSAAFQEYYRALENEPGNRSWLDGVARTWAASSSTAEAVADFLEDSLMASMEGDVRERYFKIISRLRERALRSPQGSRAHRTHGSNESIENQIVLQFALATKGERQELERMRNIIPRHSFEKLAELPRVDLSESDERHVNETLPALTEPEREFFLRELDVEANLDPVIRTFDIGRHLTADLKRIRQQRPFIPLSGKTNRLLFRLRAINGRRHGDLKSYKKWTLKELDCSTCRELHVARRLELANYITDKSLTSPVEHLLKRAVNIAFPELSDDVEASTDVIKNEYGRIHRATLRTLYRGLETHEQWVLLEEALSADVDRDQLEHPVQLNLQRRRSEILEQQLNRYEDAEAALKECWELSEDPEYLRDLVRIGLELDDPQKATHFQKKHFHFLTTHQQFDVRECLNSGLRLAERLLADPDEGRREAIDHMEKILANYKEQVDVTELKKLLAHTYADEGRGSEAIELFEDILRPPVHEQMLEDWKRLVEVHRDLQGDIQTACRLQWKIVRAFPSDLEMIEKLIRLAREAGQLEECAEELELLTDGLDGETRRSVLIRTAELLDEDLQRTARALELYERAMLEGNEDNKLYREALRKRAFSLSRQTGRQEDAIDAFQALVELEPFEPTTYRGLKNLLSDLNNSARERIVGQILKTLNCKTTVEEVRQKTIPSRAFGDDILEDVLAPEKLIEEIELMRSISSLASTAFEDKLPQLKALNGEVVSEQQEPNLHRCIESGLNAFGLNRYKLLIGQAGPMRPQVFGGGKKAIWLRRDFVENLDRSHKQFLGGFLGALSWLNLQNIQQLEGGDLWRLLEAVHHYQYQSGFDGNGVDAATIEVRDRISGTFNALARYRVGQAVDEHKDYIRKRDWNQWPETVRQFAARSGLVMSGNVQASVETLLAMDEWNAPLSSSSTQERLRRDSIIEDLLTFGVRDEFLHARYTIGLSGQPTLDAG